ncbi:MAG TPA: lytic transglycosylase domain-containing protein, partial [Thermoleophilaceae bacterium]|nr:lytic transglycosylase domain-containing protein [Thermoleophilaceae bacterium]
MKNRLAYFVACVALAAAAVATAFTYSAPDPAEAQGGELCVVIGGQKVKVADLTQAQQLLGLPQVPCLDVGTPTTPAPAAPAPTNTTPAPAPTAPAVPKPGAGKEQERGGSKKPASGDEKSGDKKKKSKGKSKSKAKAEIEGGAEDRKGRKGKRKKASRGIRNPDGSPTPSNPGFVDALPGPSTASGVPNFVIRKFRVPVFLLPIYQAAGIQYGIRWEILAAINEIETDYGRNLNVSSAGALGWMQFMPATWRQ